jgi:hypothetical protein
MTAILLPFSLMTALVMWERELRLGAGLLVVSLGIYLLINRKHPRFLARIKPTRLALVFSGSDGSWRRADAGADLSGHMQGGRS